MNATTLDYKALPLAERLQLVEDIWDSIAEEAAGQFALAPDERVELQQRLDQHRADPGSGIPWAEVRAALFGSDKG